MDVCLLGLKGEKLDEGMKNWSVQLRGNLPKHVDSVSLIDLKDTCKASYWHRLYQLSPDIIHLIPGPTPKGLLLLKSLGIWKQAKTVASATQPRRVNTMLELSPILSPDRLLVQSHDMKVAFADAGYNTTIVPAGVNLDKFSPVSLSEKKHLRQKLGLPIEERIILHVGHFKLGRNLMMLPHLLEYGQVVVVGSPSTNPDYELVSRLRSAGCIVRTGYIENIEQYYQSSDVYVFPTQNEAFSIQLPLSIFEAMACDIPVVTTRFGGLEDLLEGYSGVRFLPDFSNCSADVFNFRDIDNRTKVQEYSWESIATTVKGIYDEL